MGLSQSLYTGWTGMATHQRCMDNIGSNLSNVNTTGFKKSDFLFTNLLNKVLNGGGLPAEGARGSTNPKTIGVGSTTGAIATNQSQAPIENTNNPLDVAVDGHGYFVVNTSYGNALTRNGSFYLDALQAGGGRVLSLGDGLKVQGWNAVNGVVTPSTTVGDIVLPANGSLLDGKVTSKVALTGILPTVTSGSDFAGAATSDLEVKGNLSADNKTLTTHIFAPVTRTGDSPVSNEVQKIQVEIAFDGPTRSADGTRDVWQWTMKTVDWPNAGDPQVQIYPPSGTSDFPQGSINFYAQTDAEKGRAAGQAMDQVISPGGSHVSATGVGPDGEPATFSFDVSSSLKFDVSRLTMLDNAPGGNALETWSVNGNPKGSMARAITTFDEYTDFIQSSDADGNLIMETVRRVRERSDTLAFTKTGSDNAGTDWSWNSSLGDQSGTLRLNTLGDLASATGDTTPIAYDFTGLRYLNSSPSVQVASQDGYEDGVLQDISIDQYGKIYGRYSNDEIQLLAQLAMGTVPNTSGLDGVGGTLFYSSASSGGIMIGVAGDSQGGTGGLAPIGAGFLVTHSLESSNVDLSQEFTTLITTQRGYQGNSKTVQTSDEMLQTLIAMKR